MLRIVRAPRLAQTMALCLLLCGPSLIPAVGPDVQAQQTPPTVSLSFAWEPGFRAMVKTISARTRGAGAGDAHALTSTATMSAERAGADMRIRFEDILVEMDTTGDGAPSAAFTDQVASLMPAYLVSSDGLFIGIADAAGYHRKLHELIADSLPADAADSALAAARSLVTVDLLNSRAAQDWNTIVGAWIGAEFELGEIYSYQQREPVPILAGRSILMTYHFTANALLECERDGRSQVCVDIELVSIADPADAARLVASLTQGMAPGETSPAPVFTSLSVRNELQLVTEPDGLVPHYYKTTKTIAGTLVAEGKEREVRQIETREARYQYLPKE